MTFLNLTRFRKTIKVIKRIHLPIKTCNFYKTLKFLMPKKITAATLFLNKRINKLISQDLNLECNLKNGKNQIWGIS